MGLCNNRAQILNHAGEVFHHVVVPVANHPKTLLFKIGGPRQIAPAFAMLPAIDLDDQFQLTAKKIADEWPDRHLPREFPAIELAP